jgi:branched-chain amino acid transport system substrate-binding protein
VSQLDRRQALKLFASMGAAAIGGSALAACDSSAAHPTDPSANLPPVKIGVITPMTGVLKSDGTELGNGFKLYMKRNGGKLGGRVANVVYIDEGENPTSGKAALDTLLKKENVLAISGVVSSGVMTAIRDTVEQAQIPLVGSNASPSTLQGVRYIWRTSWSALDPGRALGKYVAEHVKAPVAMMAPDYAAGRDFVAGFKETYLAAKGNADGPPPFWTKFAPPQTNFSTELSQIANSNVEAVFVFYPGTFATEFVKQYRKLNLKQQLFACGFLTEGEPLRIEGKDAEGILTAMNYAPDLDNAANRVFAADYHKEYNLAPTTFAMAAFDAAYVLDKAIGLAGTDLTPQSLNAAIGRIGQIPSPRGPWEFTQNRTPLQKWYLREVRRDGPVLSNVVLSELVTLGA